LPVYGVLCISEVYLLCKTAEGRNHVSAITNLEVGFPLPQILRTRQCID
jgi:hypothetical protein